ncbi:hypothetical protein CI109_100460 [Kwoniella shandongensis]|uniref:Uncharacterized protein n=1 Tax=Kwoniella shandongensis TaxID=1734106 RepID=A0A5M6C3P6_9TREE|nr:uncharacterized protein CI109_001697 [Kwoniella shandongensis]KAA5529758.1 hypothetical protein CI109_001697 [Kwoniella shandongensis]
MSAPSGIKVPPSLTSEFSTALSNGDDVRALVFIIEGESFKHLTTVSTKGDYKSDILLLPSTLPSPKTPASFAYRLDSKEGGKWEWMMVTFVPDDAGVRAKMLQASSRAGLLKALGAGNFKHDWFATSISDLTPAALTTHLKHIAAPPPLSASEAALIEVREAEAAEAKRAALDPETEARRKKAIVGLGGKLGWGEGVQEALNKVAERSDDGWVVVLEIPAGNSAGIALVTSEACPPSQLASKIPPKNPSYAFYAYPTPPSASTPAFKSSGISSTPRNTFQASEGGARSVSTTWTPKEAGEESSPSEKEGESAQEQVASDEKPGKGRVFFIYCCPSASPVKYRMIYSTTVRGMQQDAIDKAGVEIMSKLETSDPADLTESYLKSSLPPSRPTHSSSLPTPSTSGISSAYGSSATATGAMFGRPRPQPSTLPIRSATQVPLPASTGPSTPVGGPGEGEEDSKETIRRAFDAFGPRVNASGASGGGFARPRPAGRR